MGGGFVHHEIDILPLKLDDQNNEIIPFIF